MNIKFAIAALMLTGFVSGAQAAAVTPCEDMLKDLRKTMETAKIGDAGMKAVKDLEAKGVERCNADDDKRADGFFADAMKLLAKK
jgi:hypothetical protein